MGRLCCPVCGFDLGSHHHQDTYCAIVDEDARTITTDRKVHYCPTCTVHNPQWVRQKKMPMKCRHCKTEWQKIPATEDEDYKGWRRDDFATNTKGSGE